MMPNNFYVNNTDLALSEDGDLIFPNIIKDDYSTGFKTIALVSGNEEVIQNISVRLKTNLRELFLHQDFGNALLKIIGQRNTRETAELGKQYLKNTILRENQIIKPEHLDITATPLDLNKILYIIKIADSPFSAIDMILEVDLQQGIRRVI